MLGQRLIMIKFNIFNMLWIKVSSQYLDEGTTLDVSPGLLSDLHDELILVLSLMSFNFIARLLSLCFNKSQLLTLANNSTQV